MVIHDRLAHAPSNNQLRTAQPTPWTEADGERAGTQAAPLIRRLVVLVPDAAMDQAEFANQVRGLAADRGLSVLLVAQHRTAEDAWAVRRNLVTLAALIGDPPQISTQLQVEAGRTWLQMIRSLLAPGDLVVCHREQTIGGGWPWQRRSLVEQLRAELGAPICVLGGLVHTEAMEGETWPRRVAGWVIPLALIAGFSFVQVQIQSETTGWVTTALLCVTALVELALVAWCVI